MNIIENIVWLFCVIVFGILVFALYAILWVILLPFMLIFYIIRYFVVTYSTIKSISDSIIEAFTGDESKEDEHKNIN